MFDNWEPFEIPVRDLDIPFQVEAMRENLEVVILKWENIDMLSRRTKYTEFQLVYMMRKSMMVGRPIGFGLFKTAKLN